MTIYEFATLANTLVALALSMLGMHLLKRFGLIHSYLHPIAPSLFQSCLTMGLLSLAIIPAGHTVCWLLLMMMLCACAPRPHPPLPRIQRAWERSIPFIVVLSISANAYLVANKGFLLFSEDVGQARVEFYQGWGIFQRLNTVCSIILGAHWASAFVEGRWRSRRNIALLLWTAYLTLTLGSKAGLLSLLTYIGAAAFYSTRKIETRRLLMPIAAVTVSASAMFWLFYGSEAWSSFGIRFVSFADGPFYFFGFERPLHVSASYPFQQLLVALRLLPTLPEASLGPAINLEQFGFDNELFGPNPQIFAESVALLDSLYPLYYLFVGIVMVAFLRSASSVYDMSLYATVVAPLIVDSQLAFSNIFNVMLALSLRNLFGRRLTSGNYAKTKPSSRLLRL